MRRDIWKPVCFSLIALFVMPAMARAEGGSLYEVTITNLTRGQVLSPPVVVSHDGGISLFDLGAPASDDLAALAEDAYNVDLIDSLTASESVRDVVEAAGPIPPGKSATVVIEIAGAKRLISFASMLVTTNDTFAAIRGLSARGSGTVAAVVPAYDAGSEGNNELCMYIPGPPCGNRFQRDTANAEGYVHVSAGVQQVGDLTGAEDWRNPVARITVTPLGD